MKPGLCRTSLDRTPSRNNTEPYPIPSEIIPLWQPLLLSVLWQNLTLLNRLRKYFWLPILAWSQVRCLLITHTPFTHVGRYHIATFFWLLVTDILPILSKHSDVQCLTTYLLSYGAWSQENNASCCRVSWHLASNHCHFSLVIYLLWFLW